MRKGHPVSALIAVLLLIGLLTFAAYRVGLLRGNGVAEIRFDASQWKSAREIDNLRTVRSQMVDDLIATHDFRGWPRSKIEELLGQPELEAKYGWEFGYYLGIERAGAFSLDNEYLVFRLTSDDRVSEFRTTVD